MSDFAYEYKRLNRAQREAVDQIDGPVLVIAGPGTGKTQLLSARVATILQQTDTLPQNILCLTFTENGAQNMRMRLSRFIGQAAYDVNIGTYHALGSELIRRFPEYFTGTNLQNPIDELGKHQILQTIVNSLSYKNPLKQSQHHLGDLISTISEVKRALLNADDLRAIADENSVFINNSSQSIAPIFENFSIMPRKLDKALPFFQQTLKALQKLIPPNAVSKQFGTLAQIAIRELESAITEAHDSSTTAPLTKWKNSWLAKNSDNKFILAGKLQNERINALADVLKQYQEALAKHGWYDFDDMIIRAISALEENPNLRFTLQEQYLYILLDEFQDTNTAQLKLVELLTDNPVNEGRPNVMAVGDDDQAIYAFQGAQYSNMLDFYNMYRGVTVINLIENYRSHNDILHTANNIAVQIRSNLHDQFEAISKTLEAARADLPASQLVRKEFLSDIAEKDWVATHINELIRKGVNPSEIAVLAPGHRYLISLVPYLNAKAIPVRYEKRENVLETPIVKQLIAMSKLTLALAAQNDQAANVLWSEVLSFDFWQIPVSDIWQIAWKVNDTSKGSNLTWSKALLNEPSLKQTALLFLTLAHKVTNETCEAMLDYLIGTEPVQANEIDAPTVRSPLRSFHTNTDLQKTAPELFYDTLSHLTVLRAKLREHQATQTDALRLADFIDFIDLYETAGQGMINTSPYNQQTNAIQLMTVFKAKGLEFEHVFLPSIQDDVWGNSARGGSNRLTLPSNIAPIRHAGASEDERLRILFVAITRAKFGLYLTASTQNYAGKTTKRLKYLNEQEQSDGSFKTLVLPAHAQTVQVANNEAPKLELLELNWRKHHLDAIAVSQLHALLSERLTSYQLSPTHLNTFIDVEYGGPEKFFFNILLRFPQSSTINSQFGSAVHETMEWLQHRVHEEGSVPAINKVRQHFGVCMKARRLTQEQTTLEIERGEKAINAYLAEKSHMFKPGDKAEQNFRNEGVFIGEVHLGGKIDRLEIDNRTKTITVVDYKTSKSFTRWESNTKLHKYRQQLYCYKLLIEGSHTFKGYKVNKGRLEFIEPDTEGSINTLELTFKEEELDRTKKLLQIMWQHVIELNFPNSSNYSPSLSGIKKFEQDLLDGII